MDLTNEFLGETVGLEAQPADGDGAMLYDAFVCMCDAFMLRIYFFDDYICSV